MRKALYLFVIVLVCAVAGSGQRVIEAESSAVIAGDKAVVRIVVESEIAVKALPVSIELLDPASAVRTTASKRFDLAAGRASVDVLIPLANKKDLRDENIAWFRISYKVGEVEGIVSMTQLLKDLFELRVFAAENTLSGSSYRVRVRAFNPFLDTPAEGVEIETELDLETEDESAERIKINGSARTNRDGFAVVDLPIATLLRPDDGEVKIIGRRNGVIRRAVGGVRAPSGDRQFVVLSDKPIYQPEQTLHVRGILVKGSEAKTVLGDAELEFRILDEDGAVFYREKVRTSSFGVASMSWNIPAGAKLGEYSIRVTEADGDDVGYHQVRVSRYDLPNFVVTAKTSKAFYFPDENTADVEVRADYLFGKPVTKGKVRVVQENERDWNWKEQKYDIDEGQVQEGETDATGRFRARFALSEYHEDLKDETWQKYRDISFAAYFTDPTTNRTEQRRFDIRVTREPIHVYLIGDRYEQSIAQPFIGYVAAFYADGTPAECRVEISASVEDEDEFRKVGSTRTNSYGIGKLVVPFPKFAAPGDDLDIKLVASDGRGRRGVVTESVNYDSDDVIRISTDRTIYKPGDTMKLRLETTLKDRLVYIDVVSGWSVVESAFVGIRNGKGELQVPYSPSFSGQLTIAAYAHDDKDEIVKANRGVIFPAKQGIKVTSAFDKEIYKPNEEAKLSLTVSDTSGRFLESALGIVVIDKAVEERARTDAEFGGRWRDLGGWLGYGEGLGSVNIKDLNELNLSKPIPDELQTVAEAILYDEYYSPRIFHSDSYAMEARPIFAEFFQKQFEPVDTALKRSEKSDDVHPVDDAGLRAILQKSAIDLDQMRDPWGNGYKAIFSTDKTRDIVSVTSAGPDEMFSTKDDLTAFTMGFEYFTSTGKRLGAALTKSADRVGTGGERPLLDELGISELRDRFGNSYKFVFDLEGRYLRLRLRSAGPDGKFSTNDWSGDDFWVWSGSVNYFEATENKIRVTQTQLKRPPVNEAEFRRSINDAGIGDDKLRDALGEPLYITVTTLERNWDKVTIESVETFGNPTRTTRNVFTPVTQDTVQFAIRSKGNDGKQGTYDDVTLLMIVHVLNERPRGSAPKPQIRPISYTQVTGGIAGVVIDPNGSVIPAATVTATNAESSVSRSTTTNDSGAFLLAGLPEGEYAVKTEAQAFKTSVINGIRVRSGSTIRVNVTLDVGSVSSTVDVAGGDVAMTETSNASVATNMKSSKIALVPSGAAKLTTRQDRATPRVRDYFPETLYWEPELITGPDGQAQVKMRLADNVTTWKMYAVASTRDGRIGVGEKEIGAFQSFFVDLDPPKFLTEGDEIYLPAQVRNYTRKRQKVDLRMEASDWFAFLAGGSTSIDVGSDASQNAIFGFRALKTVKNGKQRVTAIAQSDSDAIEKAVTVRPNGREVVRTDSRFGGGTQRFELAFPAAILPGTQRAELKVYPNLYAHVAESIEGLLQRPYGCGEQTISSTYPNLMVLRFANPDAATARKAQVYLHKGYERLLGYQSSDGGFTYWGGKETPDVALTAYAIRFLMDAKEKIEVDELVITRATEWLRKQQRPDGSWTKYNYSGDDAAATLKFTAYVARILSMRKGTQPEAALTAALKFLASNNARASAYDLALYGLALARSGRVDEARLISSALASTAVVRDGFASFRFEGSTPFYGWGKPAEIEVTALAAQLMSAVGQGGSDLHGKTIAFLLANKDRFGVWHSTQTTINVLDALLASISKQTESERISVSVNGETIESRTIESGSIEPVTFDLSGKLAGVSNVIEVTGSSATALMTQLVAAHYLPWSESEGQRSTGVVLEHNCDKTTAVVMEEITCTVKTAHQKGYGMLLTEIGTPPGADVSRESLDRAVESFAISSYEILPDRIVIYLWARPGTERFTYKFRPRYAINAQTPPSLAYDYYNPDAKAALPPMRFSAK